MTSHRVRTPLADVLRGVPGEDEGAFEWISGALVTAVDTSSTPHTVTLRLPDGAVVPDVVLLGWWAPTVDARVEVWRQGPRMLCLGAVAPAALTAAAPAVPPVAPSAPASSPATRTETVQPLDAATWDTAGGFWKNELVQGGPTDKRALWLYGDRIAAVRGAGTITGGSIYVERLATAHGVRAGANVRLGTHGYGSRPASAGGALGAVTVAGTLTRGKGRALRLPAAVIASLNGGAAGLGLEPGADAYDSPDYLRATRGAPSGALSLTIEG